MGLKVSNKYEQPKYRIYTINIIYHLSFWDSISLIIIAV